MNYQILCNISIETSINLWKEWDLFLDDSFIIPDVKIIIDRNNRDQYGLEIIDSEGSQYKNLLLKSGNCFLRVNCDWTKAILNISEYSILHVSRLLNALLMSYLSTKSVFLIHSSLIFYNCRGVLFIGPSGIGKTTQAELWMQYRGADIINGDMVYVRKEKDYFLGCGSPWHGSSPYCLNRQVPLVALIVLKQSEENSIRRLTGFEMVSVAMNSVFFPTWYKEGHEGVCQTLDALLKTIPVYELSCRPDEDAVRLTEETVFGKSTI